MRLLHREPRTIRLPSLLLIAAAAAASTTLSSAPADADDAFWRKLADKYGDSRPVIGLLDGCIDLATYTGEVQQTDVTQQSGLSATKTAGILTGSRFTLDSRYHWICAVFDGDSPAAREVATYRIPFHSERSVGGVEARVIQRDGTPVSVPDENIQDVPMAPDAPDYADLRWRVIDFGTLPDSCILDLKYTTRSSEAFAMKSFTFDKPYPLDRATYTLTTPVSVVGNFTWWTDSYKGHGEIPDSRIESVTGSQGEMQQYVWEEIDIPEMVPDELGQPMLSRVRSIDLTVAFEREWSKLLGWYYGKVEGVYAADARASELALEIVRGIDADSLKAMALFDHVRRTVRWVPIPVNLTTLVPAPPSEVLERGYGDARDMSACLALLMRSVGLDARMALVSSRTLGRFEPQFPSFMFFDHAVVHSLLPGREVWLDLTDPALGFGELSETLRGPGSDAGLTPLLVWDGGPSFWESVSAPYIEPYEPTDSGYDLRDGKVTWDPSGRVTFEATREYRGAHSLIMRRALLGKSADEQRQVFAAALANEGIEDPVVSFEAANLDSLGHDLVVTYAVARAWEPGADEVRVPSRLFGLPALEQTPSPTKRSGSLVFRYFESFQQDVTVTPPEGFAVASYPGDVQVRSSFLDFDRDYSEAGDGLMIQTNASLKDFDIDVAVFGRFLRGVEEMRKAGDEEIVFRRAALVGQAGG